jgi:hypothetical protein
MIDLVKSVRRGRQRTPARTLVYAPPGVGKTTFMASAPDVVLIPVEEGANQIGCDRLPQPRTWPELLEQLDALAQQPHSWQNVAVDTLGVAEELLETYVLGMDGSRALRDAAGGYGAGYDVIAGEWRLFLRRLETLSQRGMGVLLAAHAQVKQFADPQVGAYDRFIPALRDRTWQQTHRWCEDVLFARKATGLSKADKGGRARAVFGDERKLYTVGGTGYEAKNRYSLPKELPLDWRAFQAAVDAFWTGPAEVRERIAKLAASSGDESLAQRAQELVNEAKENVQQLTLIESQLREKLDAMKEVA